MGGDREIGVEGVRDKAGDSREQEAGGESQTGRLPHPDPGLPAPLAHIPVLLIFYLYVFCLRVGGPRLQRSLPPWYK